MILRKKFYEIWDWIDAPEILFLIGPRQVGKTTLLEQLQQTIENKNKGRTFFYTFEDFLFLQSCNANPQNLLSDIGDIQEGETIYLFLDEVQYLDDPSRFLKYIFDTQKGKIKLLISGSSSFYLDTKFKDSLAGRKIIFPIMPLSFIEFLEFKNKTIPKNFSTLADFRHQEYFFLLEEYALYGGYPRVVLENNISKKKKILEELVFSFLKKDVLERNIRKKEKFYEFLRILAYQCSQVYNKHDFSKTLQISASTIEEYGAILEKTFFIEFLRPFHKNIKKEVTKMPKVFFTDSGVRNTLIKNFSPFVERTDRGELFEQLCYQLFCQKNTEVFFWRTQAGQEIDFILLEEKKAIEIKFQHQTTGKNKHKKAFLKGYPEFEYQEISSENIFVIL